MSSGSRHGRAQLAPTWTPTVTPYGTAGPVTLVWGREIDPVGEPPQPDRVISGIGIGFGQTRNRSARDVTGTNTRTVFREKGLAAEGRCKCEQAVGVAASGSRPGRGSLNDRR